MTIVPPAAPAALQILANRPFEPRGCETRMRMKRHAPSEAGVDDFCDPFLASWLTTRFGHAERRQLIILRACLPANGDCEDDNNAAAALADTFAEIIRDAHGDVIRRDGLDLIGFWGRERLTQKDPLHAVLTAERLQECARSKSIACGVVLDAHAIDVWHAEPGRCETAIAMAASNLPFHAQATRDDGSTVMISERFRKACGLAEGVFPFGVAASENVPVMQRFYVVPSPASASQLFEIDTASDCSFSLSAKLDALGDLKPLLALAAVVGGRFSAELLGPVADMDPSRLQRALDAALRHDVIKMIDAREPHRVYAFGDDDLRDAAYQLVRPGERLRLHQAAARALEQGASGDGGTADWAHTIAQHHRSAKNERQSRRWLSKAAWQAIADNQTTKAVALLQEALAVDRDAQDQSALTRSLLQLLSVQLAVTKGNGSDKVFQAYQRSVSIAHDTTAMAWGQEFRSLWLAQSCHLVKGEVRAALTLGTFMMLQLKRRHPKGTLADRGQRPAESALGRHILVQRMQGLAQMMYGDLAAADAHYAYVLQHYDAGRHSVLRMAYGSDQAAIAHAHTAWLSTIAGDRVRSVSAARAAKRHGNALDHPHTQAHVMAVLALAALTAGAHAEAVLAAREARAIAVEHGFEYWIAWADVIVAAEHAERAPRAGLVMLESAMARYTATGALQLCPVIHALMSTAALRDGRPEQAMRHAEQGLSFAAQGGCLLYRPALLNRLAAAHIAVGRNVDGNAAFTLGFEAAKASGAALFASQIARDALRLTSGHDQIEWQIRYHAVCDIEQPERAIAKS